ncbi:MAG TPA: acyltransferase [Ferruginibacter sp.]|nr:acyltransferase [Ferruginibacter sp.]
MQERPKYYFPQLDAIRGLDFFLVFLLHAYHPNFTSGFFGSMFKYFYDNLALTIDVFFILSSFLLTWLGINEYKATGSFSFINYFVRRALRIWPLYFLLMLLTYTLVPYFSAALNIPVTLPPAIYYLLFISNYYLEGHVYFLRFLWSLSVEEQFYIIWGICLVFFQKRLAYCAGIFAVVSIIFTIYTINNNIYNFFHTLTYLFDFAAGIIAAVAMQQGYKVVEFFKRISIWQDALFFLSAPLLYVIIFCLIYISPPAFALFLDLFARYMFIIYMGLVIIEQMVNERTILKLGSQKLLVYTGKISYGLYCFHGYTLTFGLVIFAKLDISMPLIFRILIFFIINFIIAAISYQVIEKPFLKLKNKLRRV